ncbi:MAG: hypothetical protein M0Z63_13990 [Actinomycetota bacterium]|jgi:hypothetical protein|nr:hypothetical protein [Actinomycetota bacterium]
MTEHQTPRHVLLDTLVYAPAGLVLTVADELPRLAARGRQLIEGRVTTARIVGQFAVQFARRQAEERLRPQIGQFQAPAAPSSRQGPPRSRAQAGGAASERRSVDGPTAGGSAPHTTGAAEAAAVAPSAAAIPKPATGPGSVDGPTILGIPGYDSLSASQVVQRLGGLSTQELARVREHERAGRHRRTILSRIDQIMGTDGATRRADDGSTMPATGTGGGDGGA